MISIIVTVYNIEDYVDKCIESLIHQTYEDIEIIIVDDGSTDGSVNICDYYGAMDSRITVVHKENEGVTVARKVGFSRSQGDYILIVDGDDWISINLCEALMEKALNTGCDVIDVPYAEVLPNGENCPRLYKEGYNAIRTDCEKINLLEEWLGGQLNHKIHSTIWGKLYKRDIFDRAHALVPNDMTYAEDMAMLIYLISIANGIYVLQEPFYYYRVHGASVGHSRSKEMFVKYNFADEYLYRTILKTFPSINSDRLNEWYMNRKRLAIDCFDYNKDIRKTVYYIPDIHDLEGKIILYGAGKVGQDYYMQLALYSKINIVAWVDKNYTKCKSEYCNIEGISKISDIDYDVILIAVSNESLSEEICKELISVGVKPGKIKWIKPAIRRVKIMTDGNETGDIEL